MKSFQTTSAAVVRSVLGVAALAVSTLASAADLKVTESITVAASPARIWAVVGDFSGLPEWHPAVATTDIVDGTDNKVGAVRSITTKDGARIVEKLLAYDAARHTMTYRISESPLPVTNYVSTLSVAPSGSGAVVTWKSTFKRDRNAKDVDDAKAKEIVAGIYKAGFDGLRTVLGDAK